MAIVSCSLCGGKIIIDETNGEAYITEVDGSIHHVKCPEPDVEGTA